MKLSKMFNIIRYNAKIEPNQNTVESVQPIKIKNTEPYYYINFHNASSLPILIDTWINTTQESYYVKPGYMYLLESSVGSWTIHSMFTDKKDRQIWEQNGIHKFTNLGTFRCNPCIQGKYSWMEYDEPFHCIYSELTHTEVKGLITFFVKREK